jgi:predicted amidohydrolase
MKNMRAAVVQFEHTDGDKEANLSTIRRFTAEAAGQGIELIVFPECCITGYWFLRSLGRGSVDALAEAVPNGPSTKTLQALAGEFNVTVGAGLVERADDGSLYNTYVVAMPGGAWVRHRKLHCFVSEHMKSGSEYTVFDLPNGVRAGLLICYDCNIGENVRMTALQGAEILLAPHQTGGCTSPDPHCMGLVDRSLWDNRETDPAAIEAEFKGDKGRGWLLRWLPARAHDNGLFLLFSNGVGIDDDEVRTGNAMIIDPYGRILAETWRAGDDLVAADLDASLMERPTGHRWIRTRRPELYGPLAQPTGLEEDTRKLRFDGTGV